MTWNTPTYQVVNKMRLNGNQPGIVAQWKAMVEAWAEKAIGPDAAAVKAFLPLWQVRPFYTARELAPIFPMLEAALGAVDRPGKPKSPARLANELKFAKLPYFTRDGVEYFVVEQTHRAEEFENAHR
ncbi:MAG: hypothetical protein H0X34_07055 [Chthoniobacterales bacterium]|nr:hypothetical protein [Chthoniobacterales bacterium]